MGNFGPPESLRPDRLQRHPIANGFDPLRFLFLEQPKKRGFLFRGLFRLRRIGIVIARRLRLFFGRAEQSFDAVGGLTGTVRQSFQRIGKLGQSKSTGRSGGASRDGTLGRRPGMGRVAPRHRHGNAQAQYQDEMPRALAVHGASFSHAQTSSAAVRSPAARWGIASCPDSRSTPEIAAENESMDTEKSARNPDRFPAAGMILPSAFTMRGRR